MVKAELIETFSNTVIPSGFQTSNIRPKQGRVRFVKIVKKVYVDAMNST